MGLNGSSVLLYYYYDDNCSQAISKRKRRTDPGEGILREREVEIVKLKTLSYRISRKQSTKTHFSEYFFV